jgi:tetratricopeptide (TPR) repeat protein
VFLAASAAVSGAAFAAQESPASIQAAEAYKALGAGDPEMAIANYSLALDSHSLGPAEHYAAALKIEDLTAQQRATALYNRGLAYQKSGDKTAAVDDFTGALYLQPDFAPAYLARGNALRESGQNLFALSDYDKALRHNHADKARVYYAQSLAFAALKRPADERKALELAAAANPGFAPAQQKLAGAAATAPETKAADPLLTASNAPVGGAMTMTKPDLPKPVAPPAELAAAADAAGAASMAEAPADALTPAAPAKLATAATKPRKKYFDRILPESEQAAAKRAPAAETIVTSPAEPETTTASIEPASASPEAASEDESAGEQSAVSELTGWTVQVASAVSENAAWSTYKSLQSRKKVLRGKTPVVVRADLGAKGVFFRVRFGGYDSQQAAQKACAKFKSGGVSCYVSRSNS